MIAKPLNPSRRLAVVFWTAAVLLAGLGRLAAGAEQGPVELTVGSDGVQRGTITLDSYSYTPSHLIVQAGKPVELTLTSVTIIVPHNFLLKEPEAGLEVSQDVGAGNTEKVRFTPTKPGTYTFYCDKKPPIPFASTHREKGMEGRLEVR
ncbi:MAG: cupredoxin domain-containing protein [Nitrospirota bacterium]